MCLYNILHHPAAVDVAAGFLNTGDGDVVRKACNRMSFKGQNTFRDLIDFVVGIQGVGSLFGFLKVKDVVDKFAPKIAGRLLVFFPGSYENNNYRLLDGYDGWNYLAVPITADKDF